MNDVILHSDFCLMITLIIGTQQAEYNKKRK